jgi:GYF domain 2
MTGRAWFVFVDGQQHGPFGGAQFLDLVAEGFVRRDSDVWCEGMSAWCRAGDIPGLFARKYAAAAQRPTPQWVQEVQDPNVAFSIDFNIWEMTARCMLMIIGTAVVIPASFVATRFYRWIIDKVRVPRRPNIAFAGQPRDIWYVFVLFGLLAYAPFSDIKHSGLLLIPLNAALSWLVLRWIVGNISSNGLHLPLRFSGSIWFYTGWNVLFYVSFVTIIGWAFVLTAWIRWICANVEGTRRKLEFNATGLAMLWRTLVFSIACAFLIPIPWMLRWYCRWFAAQFSVREGVA